MSTTVRTVTDCSGESLFEFDTACGSGLQAILFSADMFAQNEC